MKPNSTEDSEEPTELIRRSLAYSSDEVLSQSLRFFNLCALYDLGMDTGPVMCL